MLRILGVSIDIQGARKTPPFFLVANHLSYLDILILFMAVDGYFVAKSEVARWPVLGFLARTTGTLFIDRARKSDLTRVMKLIEAVLQDGGSVIVFPEGTSTSGESVLPFKPSMFQSAVSLSMPVHVASLHYETPPGTRPAHEVVCWWGDMTFVHHCWTLMGLPSISARVILGDAQVSDPDRKSLAQQAHAAVEAIFTPVVERQV